MLETLSTCPVCQGKNFQDFISCNDHTVSQEAFSIVSCQDCGFKFTNPRPAEDTLGSYYESQDYISHSNQGTNIVNTVYKIARSFTLKNKLRIIENHAVKNPSLTLVVAPVIS